VQYERQTRTGKKDAQYAHEGDDVWDEAKQMWVPTFIDKMQATAKKKGDEGHSRGAREDSGYNSPPPAPTPGQRTPDVLRSHSPEPHADLAVSAFDDEYDDLDSEEEEASQTRAGTATGNAGSSGTVGYQSAPSGAPEPDEEKWDSSEEEDELMVIKGGDVRSPPRLKSNPLAQAPTMIDTAANACDAVDDDENWDSSEASPGPMQRPHAHSPMQRPSPTKTALGVNPISRGTQGHEVGGTGNTPIQLRESAPEETFEDWDSDTEAEISPQKSATPKVTSAAPPPPVSDDPNEEVLEIWDDSDED